MENKSHGVISMRSQRIKASINHPLSSKPKGGNQLRRQRQRLATV